MNFIRIRDGMSIKKSSIDAVEYVEDLKCNVYVGDVIYKCDYPYSTVITMLEEDKSDSGSRTNQLLEAIAGNQQRNVA